MMITVFIGLFNKNPDHFVGIFLTDAMINDGRVMHVQSHSCRVAYG